MSCVCHDQETIKLRLSQSLNSKDVYSAGGMLPSEILHHFFQEYPRKNVLHFINSEHSQIYSLDQIEGIEKTISDKLFSVYSGFTSPPSPRDVMTDIFAELESLGVQATIAL